MPERPKTYREVLITQMPFNPRTGKPGYFCVDCDTFCHHAERDEFVEIVCPSCKVHTKISLEAAKTQKRIVVAGPLKKPKPEDHHGLWTPGMER